MSVRTVTGFQAWALPICPRGDKTSGQKMLDECARWLARGVSGFIFPEGRSGERRVGEEGRSRWAPYECAYGDWISGVGPSDLPSGRQDERPEDARRVRALARPRRLGVHLPRG